MTNANECTCPSGDGSLRHPCPAHPAPVEQVGTNVGHGHVFPRADGVKMRCGGPGLCSECAADASRARAALAQPSPAPDYFAHADKKLEALLNATALILESPGHDAAHYWAKCLREYDEAHAQVAQARHVPELDPLNLAPHAEAFNEAPAEALKPEQAEAERPEVVARVVHSTPVVLDQCAPLNANDELMTVAQHAASVARWAEMFNRVEQERDATLARVAELEKQEPVATVAKVPGEDWNGLHFYRDLQGIPSGTKLYTAPVAQPEETPGEILAAKLIETWVTKHGKPAPWSTAVEITAVATNMPNDERDRLLALDDDVDAQAQHSVPAAWYYDAPSQAEAAIIDIRGMWGEDDCPTYEDVASALRRLLAAAPGKEGV
ncbi:hypothetical protein [Pseudomonas aeruginosa]|uniref:hypothetical protein n=1 Tax=Pseudomonas aeruginosa TaxID=287 RepID=UPI002042CF2A|nr:hypothetical protein [Pseudomonas aeruginosa]MCM3971792.1 hypothetical protein [Pseudomonas aeruginosa]MCM4037955.1 hypothetical protein [Pseudomonas aeruginosa]MCM4055655.1 hypothetical protein [Pseudomonas aeruginosa]